MKKASNNSSTFGFAFLFLAILLTGIPVISASAQYAYSLGSASFDRGVEVGMDGAGNAYFIGEFQDTLDFDFGPDEHLLKNNNGDVFVASYDVVGNHRFSFKISGNNASNESAGDIAVADDGFFVITGQQPFGFIDFDPDPLEEMTRTGELYIAGYSSNGQVRFAVSPRGGQNTSSGKGHALVLDEENNVYVTGTFTTPHDFNPSDTTGTLSNTGSGDVFVASYTEDGDYRYAFSFGGNGFDYGSGITLDPDGNLYIAGFFDGEASFDPTDMDGNGDKEMRVSQNASDMFLVSYDKNGRFRFVYTYDVSSRIEISRSVRLSSDEQGNIYMSGESQGTVAYDPEDADGDGNLRFRAAESLGSAFIASYTPEGLMRFATVLKGGVSASSDVSVDKNGVSFITGTFSGDVDFDPNVDEAVLSSRRGSDVFVASYDSIGAYRTAFQLPSTGISAGIGIVADSAYNVVLTGGFHNDVDMMYDAAEDWRTSNGQNDIFMARFEAAGQVSVSLEGVSELPGEFSFDAPYPNPFSSRTSFNIELPNAQQIKIDVYDILGRTVGNLFDGALSAGRYSYDWEGDAALPGGLYFIRIEGETSTQVKKVIRVR